MNNTNQFDWVNFYDALAKTLLLYRNNRDELVKKIRLTFQTININIPTVERDGNLFDIDPFTIFGFFNKSSMTEENRKKIIEELAKQLNIDTALPTSFDGVPVVNNLNAVFFRFLDERGSEDIDELWCLFESALLYTLNPIQENLKELSTYFDLVINKKGIANSKITMGLYWINPDYFLNLDGRNLWYIYKSGKMPMKLVESLPTIEDNEKISADKYFEIIAQLRAYLHSGESAQKNFKELSFEAWKYSVQVDKEKKINEKVHSEREANETALGDDNKNSVHYWIYSPGEDAVLWDDCYDNGIMAIGWDQIGDLSVYTTKEKMRLAMKNKIDASKSHKVSALATWEFANEMKIGDVVFAKKGRTLIIGRGIVESAYEFDEQRQNYKNIHKVKWTHKGEWSYPARQTPMKTLTDMTSYIDIVKNLNALFESDELDDVDELEQIYEQYDADRFFESVYMDRDDYDTLVELVKTKKNVILQGAPGVGKTFAAKRLAYSIMGEKNQNRVMMVQFHQSYSYEDFIMGFRPTEHGFELQNGVFYEFCKEAESDKEHSYFFIVDEINRGNLSKILGELFMLIESDKRDVSVRLLYSNEKFSIPRNVYIIGMMNTADRSLSMLDYALRRRFAFFDMKPAFDTDGFKKYQRALNNSKFNSLIECVKELNTCIIEDESLGEGFCIGHSYFCGLDELEKDDLRIETVLSRIIKFELIPLLKEYWFDEPNKVKDWTDKLRSAIK